MCFLCLRRDVSLGLDESLDLLAFSLLAQRCFQRIALIIILILVFSACAEMFLTSTGFLLKRGCFLCLRRDVSDMKEGDGGYGAFSLLAQRCFLLFF